MMTANAPAVLFGEALTRIVPVAYVRAAAALMMALTGVWVITAALTSLTAR
jgi:putative Ca2+/H+ antiporter (TMEM165/GDT1 family)